MIEYKLRVIGLIFLVIVCHNLSIHWSNAAFLRWLFIFRFSNLFQFPIFDVDDIVPTKSFISLARLASKFATPHDEGSHKSSRTEKKGVRFFLNICSLLCSRVFFLRIGRFELLSLKRSFWRLLLLQPNMLTEKPFSWPTPSATRTSSRPKKDSRTVNQLLGG